MTGSSEEGVSERRPAATVLVLRDRPRGPEVFMVRRHEASAFMGGAYVFPGGRVDLADGTTADPTWCDGLAEAGITPLTRASAVAHRIAAIRELFEEAGVLLARDAAGRFVATTDPVVHDRLTRDRRDLHAGSVTLQAIAAREQLRVALDALVPCARWLTPPIDVRQFDAWFFVTRVPPDQVPVHDDAETTHGEWLRPSDALARATAREIILPPPTWTTLREIEPFTTVDDTLSWARGRRIEPRQPRLHESDSGRYLVLGDGTRFRFDEDRWIAEARR